MKIITRDMTQAAEVFIWETSSIMNQLEMKQQNIFQRAEQELNYKFANYFLF